MYQCLESAGLYWPWINFPVRINRLDEYNGVRVLPSFKIDNHSYKTIYMPRIIEFTCY